MSVAIMINTFFQEVPPPFNILNKNVTTIKVKVVDSWFDPLRGG